MAGLAGRCPHAQLRHGKLRGYVHVNFPYTASEGIQMAAKFVLKKGSSGKFHFNLQAANGQVIATSETYESKAAAINGIESVKKNAPVAEVDDQTD
ncbi:MAG TPA: YegP family protein [Streptosporangiaceae bacterium]|nr:YegP family protein [Streptosporangiaceae bacterium]